MYSSLLTDDTYKRADAIYKSISDEFNPFLKEFISFGKTHDKNVLEEGKSFRALHSASMKIGIAATSSPGSKDVGKCIMDIAETMQELNMARETWLQKFRNDIIFPMERRSEQDSKYVVALRRKSQDEFKARNHDTDKAMSSLTKIKKRSLTKPASRKAEDKMQKAAERLLSAKAASEMHAHEMLNRAFSEERRRYCFFVEKQCDLVRAWIDLHRKSINILQSNLDQWQTVAVSHRDLLPGAVALIESSLPRRTNVTLDELDMTMGITHSNSVADLRHERHPNQLSSTTSTKNITVKRNASTRVPIAKKEVDLSNPYRRGPTDIKDDDGMTEDEENESENGEAETRSEFSLEKLTIEVPPKATTPTPVIHTKACYRKSDSSEMSVASQASSLAPTLNGEAPISTIELGISVCETLNEKESEEMKTPTKHQQEIQLSQPDQSVVTVPKSPNPDSDGNSESSRCSTESTNEKTETMYESLYDYSPELGGNKLCLKKGDMIQVLNMEEKGGWAYGENKRTKQRGWFPATYTVKKNVEPTSPTIIGFQNLTTPPTTPIKFDPSKIGAVPVVMSNSSHEKSNENPILNSSFSLSPPGIKEEGKKLVTGRNVFQFAKDLENPFEEIQLRKTPKQPLH